jgi:hypothetical protein
MRTSGARVAAIVLQAASVVQSSEGCSLVYLVRLMSDPISVREFDPSPPWVRPLAGKPQVEQEGMLVTEVPLDVEDGLQTSS